MYMFLFPTQVVNQRVIGSIKGYSICSDCDINSDPEKNEKVLWTQSS